MTRTRTQRALLTWQRPLEEAGSRDRHPVAELVRRSDGVLFSYLSSEALGAARADGFVGYPGLPLDGTDHSDIALAVLSRRLPPRDRSDFADFLSRFDLPEELADDALSLLAYTGARLTSDSFGVCETFEGFEAPFSYVFDVAGNRHYQERFGELVTGEPLRFEREPTNEHDPNAIRILRHSDGAVIGYLNRLQTNVVGTWLDDGLIDASVFRVNGRAQYPRVFVRANIAAAPTLVAAE